jgi:hypothetical protein
MAIDPEQTLSAQEQWLKALGAMEYGLQGYFGHQSTPDE